MKLKKVISDRWTFYTPCTEDGACELYSFLENIESKYQADRDGLVAKLRTAAESDLGPKMLGKDICHFVDDENRIFQIRHRTFRLLMFYSIAEKKAVICAAPFIKRKKKTPPEELRKARDIQHQYNIDASRGMIDILPDEED